MENWQLQVHVAKVSYAVVQIFITCFACALIHGVHSLQIRNVNFKDSVFFLQDTKDNVLFFKYHPSIENSMRSRITLGFVIAVHVLSDNLYTGLQKHAVHAVHSERYMGAGRRCVNLKNKNSCLCIDLRRNRYCMQYL